MEEQLQDKRIRISVAGSIADAAVDISNVLSVAQTTADLYLYEISSMKSEAEQTCAKMIEEAKKQCEELNARYQSDYRKWQQLQAEIQRLEEQKRG